MARELFRASTSRARPERTRPSNSDWLPGSAFNWPTLARLGRLPDVIVRSHDENLGLIQHTSDEIVTVSQSLVQFFLRIDSWIHRAPDLLFRFGQCSEHIWVSEITGYDHQIDVA